MMPPTRLIYVSHRKDHSAEGLDAIFDVSRKNNLRDDITGALIVSDEYFVQLLEGDRLLVSQCMVRITHDVRHAEIEFVATNLVPNRLFAEWSLHRIETSAIDRNVLKPFLINGAFQPTLMPQAVIEDLCRRLSGENCKSSRA